MALQQLTSCQKLAELIEKEVARLSLDMSTKQRLETLLRTAKESLAEAEQLMCSENVESRERRGKQLLWERKLLDLSMRNNLLNMKVGKKVTPFTPCPIDQLEDLLADGEEYLVPSELVDAKILKSLYRTARLMMEENGVNTLFLTLGTIHYDEKYSAPILLLPIDIVSAGKDKYTIRAREEETMLNFTLVEYLRQNYDIEITFNNKQNADNTELPHDAHGIDVNLVLYTVKQAISQQEGWSVMEDSHIGIFSFAKYIMWNDIHSHGYVLQDHPILKSLMEGRLLLEDKGEKADARMLDNISHPNEFALPLPCDSSQMEAVVEAANGRSFILYGPPGTGKSQTITNIIANAMYQGKRVLFVAQKKAALDVVEQRLQKLGIADYCLELHSNKVDKKHFLCQLQRMIDLAGERSSQEDDFKKLSDQLFAKRMELMAYINALYEPQSTGFSLQECISESLSISGMPIEIPEKFREQLNKEKIEEICNKCIALDAASSILGYKPQEHPLHELTLDLSQRDLERAMVQDLKYLQQSIDNAQKQADSDMNKRFMKKTAKDILQNDYRWKHFCQMAHPTSELLDDFPKLKDAAVRWEENISLLPQWIDYHKPFAELQQMGLGDIVDRYKQGETGKDVAMAFKKGAYRCMAMRMIKQIPALAAFNGMMFEHVIEQYRQMTADFQQLTIEELQARLAAIIPIDSNDADISSEMTLLRKRIANKGRGTSIRGIIDQMPHLLPALCPCMLMSPLSVAQYIDIDAPKFDLVIFDEASQMPTGEAVGAIARGKAIVVVGDPKQMPPTSFFTTAITDDDNADMDDLESILDDCISLSIPNRYLGWHYRSQHESLISFCNKNYYDGKLLTFPSADDMVSHVNYVHVDGIYDYGKSRSNRIEAEKVVEETIRRLAMSSSGSIGIVAFSKQQSDLIEDLLNEALSKQPELETKAFNTVEPLFVKNLENVQGDERDVIILSIGYGPDKDGHISMNFGPLNKVGGERRLNVALSRARSEMMVFSSLRPDQIDERRTNADGVLGLKNFMQYAEQSCMMSMHITEKEDVEVVIQEVVKQLTDKGYQLQTNVGTSSFRVNIAIVDNRNPERYLLGIICDGKRYYALKTTRDREVVQPTVLKMLGWNLMHLWTLDWFSHPDMVIKGIEEKIESIRDEVKIGFK